jgi:hypothetical protein
LQRADVSRRLVAVVLLAQAVWFALATYWHRHEWLSGDNYFYESPAWNLASGHGLSFSRSEWEDPYLTALHEATHPEARGREFVPVIAFAPGYSLFLALVYLVTGRSVFAAVLANGALLAGFVLVGMAFLRRALGRRAVLVAAVLFALFPMWAFFAAMILSDMLHAFLFGLFALLFTSEPPTLRRAAVAGLVLGAATLVRPYALLVPFVLVAARLWFRLDVFGWPRLAVLALSAWSVVGIWTARNHYEFGVPILVTSMGPGLHLWVGTYQCTESFGYTPGWDEMASLHARLGVQDSHRVDDNARLRRAALERIAEAPGRWALACLRRVARLWIPMGRAAPPLQRTGYVLAFGTLFVSMIAGLVLVRRTRNGAVALGAVLTVYYWLVFVPLGVESRMVLPVRLFALMLSAVALERASTWVRAVRQRMAVGSELEGAS